MSTDTNIYRRARAVAVPWWAVVVLVLLLMIGVALVVRPAAVKRGGVERGGGTPLVDLPRLRDLMALRLPRYAGPGIAVRERRAVERVMKRTPLVAYGGRGRRQVALTFDDGPGPYTWRVVRVLHRMHVRATFFQVGQMIAAFPGAAREVERSFPVGDHTLSHPMMSRLPPRVQRFEVLSQAARLRAVEGARFPVLFRPPYAAFDAATLAVLRRERMLMVLWDVDSRDWTRPGARAIVRNVVSRVRPGSIVLMHDAGGDRSQTVAALPLIVRALRARGFRFVTVPRMMLTAPPAARQKLPPHAGA
jgi:peptidoglycan/xylan/chitin deacetylase (PgdA/CDA1 family)